jgi:hypothetical protein
MSRRSCEVVTAKGSNIINKITCERANCPIAKAVKTAAVFYPLFILFIPNAEF